MYESLESVRAAVARCLQTDPFPASVEPAFLRAAVRDYPCRGGKRLRPALTLWSCGAVGGDPEKALCAACALEIYHNWTLVHDDMIDRDRTRRGEKTCHVQLEERAERELGLSGAEAALHGERMALLCGDLQQDWAFSLLGRSPLADGVRLKLYETLVKRGREVISGEACDVEMAQLPFAQLSVEAIETMYALKTGALLRCGAELGAIAASASEELVRLLGDAAGNLATAFQLKDDILGIFGDAGKFGKPIGADLRERKPTLLLLETVRRLEGREKADFTALLGHDISPAELELARGLMRSCGALKAAQTRIETSAAEGMALLRRLPDTPYRANLLALFSDMVTRDR